MTAWRRTPVARALLPLVLGCQLAAGAAPAAAAELEPGSFLVASRDLRDPNFRETVVVILEHGRASGAAGLVINRPSRLHLADVLPDLEGVDEPAAPVFLGGPVEPTVFTVLVRAAAEPERSERVFADVYRSGSRTLLERLATERGENEAFRVFAGYAGWAPGQLEMELRIGGWHVVAGRAATIFEPESDKVWPRLILIGTAEWARRGAPAARSDGWLRRVR